MSKTPVTDSVLAAVSKKQHEIYRRLTEGTLDSALVLPALQDIIEGHFTATVPTLAGLIKAAGFRPRDVNSDITVEHFPLVGPVADVSAMSALSQADLGGTGRTTAEYEAAIDRQGYRPATLAEQLAWAKETWNGRDTVVALGSSWSSPLGFRLVPYLYDVGGQRRLFLVWGNPGNRWGEDCRFLVVRK